MNSAALLPTMRSSTRSERAEAGSKCDGLMLLNSFSRRRFLASAGLGVACLTLPGTGRAKGAPASDGGARTLRPQPGSAMLLGEDKPPTPIWGFDGTVPGPLLRVPRGSEVKIRVINGLPEPTAIHWHGIRITNSMDGTPLTQKPIAPGGSFDYRFTVRDAGTYWYRPDITLYPQQLDRGLYGLLIVEEPQPPEVDREVVLVFDDWRLAADGTINTTPDAPQATGQDGAGGGHITVNSHPMFDIPVKTNERVRLRILNATRARFMVLRLDRHAPLVMAIDGQPAEPFLARDGRLGIGPGNRVDLLVDAALPPGTLVPVIIDTDRGALAPVRFVYDPGEPVRATPRPEPSPFPPNPLPERMNFQGALRADVPMEDVATSETTSPLRGADGPPLFRVKRGRTVVLAAINRTASPQAMHVHGHHFRLLDRLDDGWKPFWLDTTLVPATQTARIAFVADNPGKWMIHCQMVDRRDSSMSTWFEVT